MVELLTPGEREILELVAQGLDYRAVAAARNSSVQTVKNQMYMARQALDARNTIHALVILGWLKVPRRHALGGPVSMAGETFLVGEDGPERVWVPPTGTGDGTLR